MESTHALADLTDRPSGQRPGSRTLAAVCIALLASFFIGPVPAGAHAAGTGEAQAPSVPDLVTAELDDFVVTRVVESPAVALPYELKSTRAGIGSGPTDDDEIDEIDDDEIHTDDTADNSAQASEPTVDADDAGARSGSTDTPVRAAPNFTG